MAITRYLQIAEEEKFAEEADRATAKTIDPESVEIDPEDEDKLIHEGISGLDRIAVLGMYSTAGDISTPFDNVVTPWFFKWALGGYEQEATTNKFFPQRKPTLTSFTAWTGRDVMEQVFLGNVVEELELEVEDEWAMLTVSTVGAKDKKGTLEDTLDYDEGDVFAAPSVEIERGQTDLTAHVDAMTLTIETGADMEEAHGPGSRFPKRAYTGEMVVELEMEIGFTQLDQLESFWGGTNGPSESDIEDFSLTLHVGQDIDIILPRAVYIQSQQPVEGRDHITQTVVARGLVDPQQGNEGPIIVSVDNGEDYSGPGETV